MTETNDKTNQDVVLDVEEVRALYGDADSVHDFDHILRVMTLAERIAEAEGADLSIVRTAALLHDLARAESTASGGDHAHEAAAHAEALLRDRGAPMIWINAVTHAIKAHRFRTSPDPLTIEAQALFDADKLDAIGAIGVGRAFAYGGAHNQRLWSPFEAVDLEDWKQNGDGDDHTPVHEFIVKLSRIKDRLYTETGRKIATGRHAYMEEFYRRLDAEVRGDC